MTTVAQPARAFAASRSGETPCVVDFSGRYHTYGKPETVRAEAGEMIAREVGLQVGHVAWVSVSVNDDPPVAGGSPGPPGPVRRELELAHARAAARANVRDLAKAVDILKQQLEVRRACGYVERVMQRMEQTRV